MTDEDRKKAEELLEQGDFEAWRKHLAATLTDEDREWLAKGGIV
jgi:hypothetical protein